MHQVAKLLELQLQHQSFQWIFRVNFFFGLTDLISVLSEGFSGFFSSTTIQKHHKRERFVARTKQGEQAVHAQMVWTTWMAFRQGFLRTMLGEKVSGYMISSRPFWLVGGEVTGWYFWNLNLLIPTSLGSACSWSACSHHPPPVGGGLLVSATMCSDGYTYPLRRNRTLL